LSNLTSREVLRGGAVLEMGPSDLILYTPAAIEFYLRDTCRGIASAR
jgi:hypothetical protein